MLAKAKRRYRRFPLGVFATATYQLAIDLHSEAFRVIGAFQAVQVTAYWIYVLVFTSYKFYNRTLFVAPELENFAEEEMSRWKSWHDRTPTGP
jgi:hypothetical protein